MSQPPCESIVAIIQKLTQDLYMTDAQLHTLEVEGMNQIRPWAYVVLQRRVDRLLKKKRALQYAWDRAMNELAICRSNQHSSHATEVLGRMGGVLRVPHCKLRRKGDPQHTRLLSYRRLYRPGKGKMPTPLLPTCQTISSASAFSPNL